MIVKFICPDRLGLVSQLSRWVAKYQFNIHNTETGVDLFLSRIEWHLDNIDVILNVLLLLEL